LIAWPAIAGAGWVAALCHESIDDTVEGGTVKVAFILPGKRSYYRNGGFYRDKAG